MDKAGWIRSSCKCIFGMHVLISYENEDIHTYHNLTHHYDVFFFIFFLDSFQSCDKFPTEVYSSKTAFVYGSWWLYFNSYLVVAHI